MLTSCAFVVVFPSVVTLYGCGKKLNPNISIFKFHSNFFIELNPSASKKMIKTFLLGLARSNVTKLVICFKSIFTF
jgi:hypothetical protein